MELPTVTNPLEWTTGDISLETVLLRMSSVALQVQSVLEQMPQISSSGQQHLLDEYWQQQRLLRIDPQTLAIHAAHLFFLETRYVALRSPSKEEVLLSLEEQIADAESHLRRVIVHINEQAFELPLTFVFSHSFEPGSESKVWLYTLNNGLQEDGDIDRFVAGLILRLREPATAQELTAYLPQAQRALVEGESTPIVSISFAPLSHGFAQDFVDDLQAIQRQAIEQVMSAEDEPPQETSQLEAALQLTNISHGLQERVAERLRRVRVDRQPEWLRFLKGEELTEYQHHEKNLLSVQQRVDEYLGDLVGHSEFAAHKIDAYVLDHLGLMIDASQLCVQITHQLDLETESLRRVNSMSLVSWVVSGGYHGDALEVRVLDPAFADSLTGDFIQTMIDALELRLGFTNALEERYLSSIGHQLLNEAVGERLALATLAARYQGIDLQAIEQLEAAQHSSEPLEELGIEVGSLLIEQYSVALKDLFYLSYSWGDGRRFILYAPGSPGADMKIFNTPDQINLEVGGWTNTEHGQDYLVGQVPVANRAAFAKFLKKSQRLYTSWTRNTVTLEPWLNARWSEVVSQVAVKKVHAILDELRLATPQWYIDAPRHQRQQMADLDVVLGSVQGAYQELLGTSSFADFSHQNVQKKLNEMLGTPPGEVNPDTVLVETESGVAMSLTRTVVIGYPAHFNFSEFARITSTTGQNLTRLDRRLVDSYIRTAKLGGRYIDQIQSRLLDKGNPDYERRRTLFRHMLRLQMQRAWLSETMQGHLDQQQSEWLGAAIADVFALEPPVVGGDDTFIKDGLYQLSLRGRWVEGVYVFRRVLGDVVEDLIYTPDAPDGVSFRTPEALSMQWGESGLDDYFFQHVGFKDQPTIGTLIDEYERAGDGRPLILDALGEYGRIADLANEFNMMFERAIAEVDADTSSTAERISALVVDVAVAVVSTLAMPFPPATLAISVALTLRSFARGVLAYRDGDRSAALTFFLVAGLGVLSISGVGGRLATLISQLSKGPSSPNIELLKMFYTQVLSSARGSVKPIAVSMQEELTLFLQAPELERKLAADRD